MFEPENYSVVIWKSVQLTSLKSDFKSFKILFPRKSSFKTFSSLIDFF